MALADGDALVAPVPGFIGGAVAPRRTVANSASTGRRRLSTLEQRLGYAFSDQENLERALTHASRRKRGAELFHYEQLEFLGDRVLGLAVADLLHRAFPQAREGELSLRFNAAVNAHALAEISDELGLHEFIRTGDDIKQVTARRMKNLRADVLEAVIAAIYLDGGLEAASDFVRRRWRSRLDSAPARRDSKTELQEWAHSRKFEAPTYRVLSREGPDHDPRFTVSVTVGNLAESIGAGQSKRAAEQDAARGLLEREGVWSNSEGGD
jgi:ribonuclease-3